MTTATSNDFLTNRAWHRAVLCGEDVILRCTSALEHLELFFGYMREKTIDVYAKNAGPFDNINYHLVDSFSGIDTVRFGNVLCTSVNQTVNDTPQSYGVNRPPPATLPSSFCRSGKGAHSEQERYR